MKNFAILAVAAMAVGASAQEVVVRGSGGYGSGSAYNRLYNVNKQVQFTGKVVGKSFAAPMKGMAEGMSILVKTPKTGTLQVDLGPRWFVADQFARVNVGDQVKVIGSDSQVNGRRVIIAKQVVNPKGKVLALRDLGGSPYWVASRKGTPNDIPNDALTGTIVSSNTITLDNVPMVGYVVQTPNGNVNVVTAPSWYWNRQDFTLNPGVGVQIVGVNRMIQAAPGVFIADSIYTGGNTIVLRNGGVPVWQGWGY